MDPSPENFAEYVDHPRFGRAPRFTGLDPNPDSPKVHLHWNTGFFTEKQLRNIERVLGWRPTFPDNGTRMIPGTAVEADLSRQTPATVPITHYYDLDTICRDCERQFIFFAEEQKYWYEELGFKLYSGCIRCPPCRKRSQSIARKQKRRYEKLFHIPHQSLEQSLEMAGCCLTLIEDRIFHPRQTEHVRMLLKRIPEDRRSEQEYIDLWTRLLKVEKIMRGGA